MGESKWEIDKCVLKECPLVKEEIPIIIQPEDISRIKALLKKYKDKEWLMYLYGDILKEGVIISGMTIPTQEVSGGSVDNIEAPLPECIGTIHSHNTIGAFHSGTDETYIQSNHRVCITVNNKLEFAATVDIISECKRPIRVKANVFRAEPEINLESFLKEADERIKEHKTVYAQGYTYKYQGYENGYSNNHGDVKYKKGRVWQNGIWRDPDTDISKKEVSKETSIATIEKEKEVAEKEEEYYMGFWG